MEDNVVFKTAAVGGFEKRAVLDYIYKMNEQTELEKRELNDEIHRLQELIQNMKDSTQAVNNNLRTQERDLSTVSNELAEEKRARLELVSVTEKLQEEVLQYQKLAEQQKQEKEAFIEKNKAILQQNESLEAQQAEIEKASYQLGRVMLDARTDADNIVSNAKEQAEELLAQVQQEVAAQQQQAEQQIAEKLASAEEQAKSQLEEAESQAKKAVSDADQLSELTINNAKERADQTIQEIQQRVGVIVNTTQEVTDTANVQFRALRRETLAIRQAVQEALQALQKKADSIDVFIENAQNTISEEEALLATKKLEELPEINLDEIKESYYNGTYQRLQSPIIPLNEEEKEALVSELREETQEVHITVPWAEDVEEKEVDLPPVVDEEPLLSQEDPEETPVLEVSVGEPKEEALPEELLSLEVTVDVDEDEEKTPDSLEEPIAEDLNEEPLPELSVEVESSEEISIGSESELLADSTGFSSSMARPPKKVTLEKEPSDKPYPPKLGDNQDEETETDTQGSFF